MNRLTIDQIVALVSVAIVLCVGIVRIPDVMDRARVPFVVTEIDGVLIVSAISDEKGAAHLRTGDRIIRMDGVDVTISETLEHLADVRRVGDLVAVEYDRGGMRYEEGLCLVPFYDSPRFALIMAFVGISICAIAAFIAWQSMRTLPASLLQWSLLGLGSAILLTQGRVDPGSWGGFLARSAFFGTYLFSTAGFFLFAYSHPTLRLSHPRVTIMTILAVTCIVVGMTAQNYLNLLQEPSAEAVHRFQNWYDLYHAIQALLVAGMIGGIVGSYRAAKTIEERRRVQWILWGLAAGPLPFVMLIIIPNVVISRDLIPEDLATIFLLITPFSLAVSLLRHQLFDIERVIRRSIVYGVMTAFIGSVYAVSVLLVASTVQGVLPVGEYSIAILMSMGVALAFNPLRRRLQDVVDRTLFPMRTDYRNAVRHSTQELHAALSTEAMCSVLCRAIQEKLPVVGVDVFVKDGGRHVLRGTSGHSFEDEALDIPVDAAQSDKASPPRPWHWNELRTEGGVVRGLVRLRFLDPSEHLDLDERDYLQTICNEAAMALDRLELQRSVIMETEERRRLEELNALKSYFVSSVSHELRTPLTSIRMFAELLSKGVVTQQKKRREYLEIIDNEAERLARMIDNVLDFSRIERGTKEYRWGNVDLVKVIRRAVSAMAYPFEVSSARLKIRGPKKVPLFAGDADALQAAIINLLSNALKYSGKIKAVRLTYGRTGARLFVRVADKGFGIEQDKLEHIYERFYRVRTERTAQVGGMGLGLSIVKHVIEAHDGTINVQSALGKGSTFTIFLPLKPNDRRMHETNADR